MIFDILVMMSVYIYGKHAMEHALLNVKRKIHVCTDEYLETEPIVMELNSVNGRVIALDQMQEIRNIGAVIRSAACFGVNCVLLSTGKNCPNILSREHYGLLAKTACGGLEYVNIVLVQNMSEALKKLKQKEYWIVGLDESGTSDLPTFDKICLVIGQEGKGMRRLVQETCDVVYRIPTNERFGCFNASVAGALGMWKLWG